MMFAFASPALSVTKKAARLYVSLCAVSGLMIGLYISSQPLALPSFLLSVLNFPSQASTPTPPTISLSEIMSCPTTGSKEWVELQRSQDSATQLPTTTAFTMAGYQLEDDKAILWTGTESVPVPGPVTGLSGDPISESIGGYFAANDPLTTIRFNRHYLNNTGDILKLLSPNGELLDQVVIPGCSENGKSWTFQDGDWQQTTPTPDQENPAPSPTPNQTPSPMPSPSPTQTPTPVPSQRPSPVPSPTSQPSPNPSSSPAANPNSNLQTISIPQPASYLAKINQNSQRILGITTDVNTNPTSTNSSKISESSQKISTGTLPQPGDTQNPYNYNLLYSPDRSISAYLSAILGGALLTTAAGLLSYRSTQELPHQHTNNTSESAATSL